MEVSDQSLQHILITGATSSIGSALARRYARQGVRFYLHGRNGEKLRDVAESCRQKGAEVESYLLDVRDFASLQEWLKGVPPLDLVIINAGMNSYIGPDGEPEPFDEMEALLDVNLKAAMVIAQALLPAMQKRGKGQIAFVSSLAAYFGLPVTPSYCASKAGLKAYGEALRGWGASHGIKVNVIMPGYVKSPMCDAMPGPKPFLMQPEKAACLIQQGLAKNIARISFPFPLNLGTWFLAVLPAGLSTRIVRFLGYNG